MFAARNGVRRLNLRHQRNRIALHDEAGQVHLRVGDARRKAELVDLPEAIEIGGLIVADGELHVSSLGLHWQPAQATPPTVAFSIFSIAMIATHSLFRFR